MPFYPAAVRSHLAPFSLKRRDFRGLIPPVASVAQGPAKPYSAPSRLPERPFMAEVAKLTIRLNPADNIVVARADLLPGTPIPGEAVTVRARVPIGHKLATRAIAK